MDKQLQLESFFDDKETYLDNFIASGSDHELFIASYIHGHFSVVAAHTLQHLESVADANEAITYFTTQLKHSVNQAINEGELEVDDASDVKSMLENLL